MPELDALLRKQLKTRAQALHPILQLGEKGLTEAVLAEIDRALAHHDLIKVRAATLNRDERTVALTSICERIDARAVQHIGKIFVLYREKPPAEPGIRPPRRGPSGWNDRKANRDPERRRKASRAKPPPRRRPPARR